MRIPSRIGVAARSKGECNYVLAQLAPYNVNGQVERAALGMTPRMTLLACCAAGRTSHGVIDLNHVDLAAR